MSKLPEEWKTETIGNFCDILDNQRVPISSEKRAEIQGDIPYYGANGVQDYINDFIFNETLVLLAEDGGHFHEYQTRPIAYMVHGKSWVNNHTHVLRAKNGENYFLYYSLVHKDITSFINGGTRAKLNRGELIKIPLTIPPLEEQKKIAEILSTIDQKIAFVDNQIEETELLKKGLMQKLLTEGIGHTEFKDSEIGRIPVEWEVDILNNITKITDSLHMTPKFEEEGFPMVRVADIKLGKLNLSNALKVSEKMYEMFTKSYTPKKGDIVLSRVGSYGVSSFVDTEEPFCMGQNTVVINPNVNSFYLYSVLNSENIKKQIEILSYGSGYKSLSLKNIRELKIKVPPLEEQQQIAEILSTTDEKLENLKVKKESFEELKKGLMQKLLTGEVRV